MQFYDVETKNQSIKIGHSGDPECPKNKKFLVQKSARIDYSMLLTTLQEKNIERKRGNLCKGILLLQDNDPAFKSYVAVQIICDLGFKLFPNSQGLAGSNSSEKKL